VQLTSGLIGLGFSAAVVVLVLRGRLRAGCSVGWLLAAVVFVGFGLFPCLADLAAARLGVSYPPTLAFVVALALLGVKSLFMDIDRSRQERRLRRAAQRLALLDQIRTPGQTTR